MRLLKNKIFMRLLSVVLAVAFVVVFYCFGVAAVDIVKGDFDGNGKVSSADARQILRVVARLDHIYDADVFSRCDVNGDGYLRSDDARRALRTAARLEPPIIVTETEPLTDSVAQQTAAQVSAADTTSSELIPIPSDLPVTAPSVTTAPVPEPTYIIQPVDDVYMEKPYYPAIPSYEIKPDSFVFITFGYGHGVGLSQYGAIGMARHGYNYLQILAHYFQGVSFIKETVPVAVSTLHTGEQVDTFELMCRVVQQEIAGVTKSTDAEAVKAQAVAAYTLLKSHNFRLPNQYTMAYTASMSSVRSDVIAAVSEVIGTYMIYNGQLISAPFFAYSAGVTTDAATVWGTASPYLRPVTSYYDIDVRTYSGYADLINVSTFSSDLMRKYIKSYDSSIALADDPAQWIQVLAHDMAVSPEIGYVSAMRLGNKVLTGTAGQVFRMNIMGLSIKSHCFTVIYYDNNLVAHNCGAVMS